MSPRLHTLLMTTTALLALAPRRASPGPTARPWSAARRASAAPAPAIVTVNQASQNAIINWNTFNIGTGETHAVQPAEHDRRSRSTASPAGTAPRNPRRHADRQRPRLPGQSATASCSGPMRSINTAGFLATTHDINNADFMAGRYNFNIPGGPTPRSSTWARSPPRAAASPRWSRPACATPAPSRRRSAPSSLASGNIFTLDFYGDKLITLGVGDQIASQVKDVATGQTLKSLVSNEGKLKANGGQVELTAAAARAVVDFGHQQHRRDRGELDRHPQRHDRARRRDRRQQASGRADADREGVRHALGRRQEERHQGGTIVVTGENIEVGGAKIDASGKAGGGKVLIGGDWGGGASDARPRRQSERAAGESTRSRPQRR